MAGEAETKLEPTKGAEEEEAYECRLPEDISLDECHSPLTPHSRVRLKWKVAAKRSLDQIFEDEETTAGASETEQPGDATVNHREGVRRRTRGAKSVFLHEGDTHRVWKGRPREKRPVLADIALVALQKKRERDFQERQRHLYNRVAATQAALKDQAEELLCEEDDPEEQEEDTIKEVETKVQGRKRMTFKQASAKALRESKKRFKSSTTLTDIVNQHMKDTDAGGTLDPAAQRQSFPANRGSGNFTGASLPLSVSTGRSRVMSIHRYKSIIRQRRPGQSLPLKSSGSFAESSFQLRNLPRKSSPSMKRNVSDPEVTSTPQKETVEPPVGQSRAPKVDALKLMAAERKRFDYQKEKQPQVVLESPEEDAGRRVSPTKAHSVKYSDPTKAHSPLSVRHSGPSRIESDALPNTNGFLTQSNGSSSRTGPMDINEPVSPSSETTTMEEEQRLSISPVSTAGDSDISVPPAVATDKPSAKQ